MSKWDMRKKGKRGKNPPIPDGQNLGRKKGSKSDLIPLPEIAWFALYGYEYPGRSRIQSNDDDTTYNHNLTMLIMNNFWGKSPEGSGRLVLWVLTN